MSSHLQQHHHLLQTSIDKTTTTHNHNFDEEETKKHFHSSYSFKQKPSQKNIVFQKDGKDSDELL